MNNGKLRDNKTGRFLLNGGIKCKLRDKPCPDCGKLIMRKSTYCRGCSQSGERSALFKSGNASYSVIHKWVRRWKGVPISCSKNYKHKAPYYWGNISGEYKRDISDWHSLCTSCNNLDGVKIHERFHKELGMGVYAI